MSVINNVLKDLENKPSSFTPLELADVPDNKAPVRLQYWGGAALALLIVAVLFAYFFYQSKPAGSTVRHESIEPVKVIPADREMTQNADLQALPLSVNEQPLIVKPDITGLQLNETEEFLELTLQLPLGAQSFLKQSSQNRYVFLISNAAKKIIT
ncbi:MAG: hypothetical protein KAU21_10025, partial [Gammaproteobacteria bacterium]|nr:hypothetical protein [Gammaproteobacteria bacterium]